MIPKGYRPAPKDVDKSITGNWITVTTKVDEFSSAILTISGELIAIQSDTLYVLTDKSFLALPVSKIKTASVSLFALTGTTTFGLLSYIPNVAGALAYVEYAGEFLVVGSPLLILSIISRIAELQNSTLRYPEHSKINELVKYSRFPQGLPTDLDRSKLHLIVRK